MPDPHLQFQYQAIAHRLQSMIKRGEFRERGKLPSERELAQRFGVQRNTIRQALQVLQASGAIATSNKSGSFVRGGNVGVRNALVIGVHSEPSPELSQLVAAFRATAERAGYEIQRFNTDPHSGELQDHIPLLDQLSPRVAGLALWPHSPISLGELNRIRSVMPLVLVDRRIYGFHTDSVRFDDVDGGRQIANHLIGQGHTRIAFVADEMFAETVQQRWQGFVDATERAGIPVDPRLSLFFNGLHEPMFGLAMNELINNPELRPTAIMGSNDVVALSVLRYLNQHGVRVPEDIAVTGYGNGMPEYADAIGLTNVHQPFDLVGHRAAEMLIERIGDNHSVHVPQEAMVPVRLINRRSTGLRIAA